MNNDNNTIEINKNDGNIKTFLYNNELYRKVDKENHNKLIKGLLIFSIIEIICIAYIIISFNIDNNDIVRYIMGGALGLAIILFFPWFYYFMNVLIEIFGNKNIFSDRCYIITNNKFLSLKYGRNFSRIHLRPSNNSLLSIIEYIYNIKSIKEEDEEIREKMKNAESFDLNDLYSCIEIINVYNIKEYNDRYEIKCDYIEKVGNKNYVKDTLTIYKYYDNYDEIYNYLNSMRTNSKKEVIRTNKNENLLNFALKCCDNKMIYIVSILFVLYGLFTKIKELPFDLVFVFYMYFAGVYILKKAKKYCSNNEEKNKINKKLKIDSALMYMSLILSIVLPFIFKTNFSTIVTAYLFLGIFVLFILFLFNKN